MIIHFAMFLEYIFFSGYRLVEKLPCDNLSDNIFDRFKPTYVVWNLTKKEYEDYKERFLKKYCNICIF